MCLRAHPPSLLILITQIGGGSINLCISRRGMERIFYSEPIFSLQISHQPLPSCKHIRFCILSNIPIDSFIHLRIAIIKVREDWLMARQMSPSTYTSSQFCLNMIFNSMSCFLFLRPSQPPPLPQISFSDMTVPVRPYICYPEYQLLLCSLIAECSWLTDMTWQRQPSRSWWLPYRIRME